MLKKIAAALFEISGRENRPGREPMYKVDYPRVRTAVKKNHAFWVDAYATIESRCRQAQHERVLRIDGQHHLLIMTLFARTV